MQSINVLNVVPKPCSNLVPSARDASEAAHAKFKDEKSEFLSFVKLWRWYAGQVAHKASQRKLVALLRQNFLSPVRLREWHDVHTQLSGLVGEQGWRVNTVPATSEHDIGRASGRERVCQYV